MAQPNYTPIQLYRTATASAAPLAGNLTDGELAINTADGKLFYKDSGGTVRTIADVNATAGYFFGTSAAGASVRLYEDTDNGTNYVALKAADSIASNVTWTLPATDGTSGQVLSTNGSGTLSWASAGGNPGGSDTQIQYNNSGAFGGSSILTFNKSTTAPVMNLGGVAGVTSAQFQVRAPSATNGPWVGINTTNDGSTVFWTWDGLSVPMRFVGGGVEAARFVPATGTSANFGVGTTAPQARIHCTVPGGSAQALKVGNSSYSGTGDGPWIGFDGGEGVSGWNTARIHAIRVDANAAGALLFYTNRGGGAAGTIAENGRFNSEGNLLLSTTAQLTTNLTHTITKTQSPSSNSTAWADQMSPLVVYGNFSNGGNDQLQSSAITAVGWSSLAVSPGAIFRGWWSNNGPSLGTPVLQFQVARNGNVTNTNNSYGSLSDARLKENIVDATPKLDNLNKLRVVNFNLKQDLDKQKQIGLIAQEVEQVFPGLVETDGEGTKSIKYSVLVPMLLKAVQELNAKVETLTAEVNATKGQA